MERTPIGVGLLTGRRTMPDRAAGHSRRPPARRGTAAQAPAGALRRRPARAAAPVEVPAAEGEPGGYRGMNACRRASRLTSSGRSSDALLSEKRDRALRQAPRPVEVTTDKAPERGVVVDHVTVFRWMQRFTAAGASTGHGQYGNNRVEAVQHEVTHRERAERIGGPSHRQSSSGLVLAACPHSGVRRRCCACGVRSPGGEAQGLSFRPGVTGKGKTGRVNVSESSLTPRYPEPSWTGTNKKV
jgi:hypothetical protein